MDLLGTTVISKRPNRILSYMLNCWTYFLPSLCIFEIVKSDKMVNICVQYGKQILNAFLKANFEFKSLISFDSSYICQVCSSIFNF